MEWEFSTLGFKRGERHEDQMSIQTRILLLLTHVGRRTFANGKDGAQLLLFLRQALLQALQFQQAFAALVLHGTDMLDEVQLGLGGVVTQDTVVVARLALHSVLVLLQML